MIEKCIGTYLRRCFLIWPQWIISFCLIDAFSNDVTLFWCPNTMKRRPCWCPKPILWELKLFLCEKLSFVPINLQSCWPREQTLYSLFHPGLVLRNDLFNKKKIIFHPLNSFLDFLTSFLWSTKYLFKKTKILHGLYPTDHRNDDKWKCS